MQGQFRMVLAGASQYLGDIFAEAGGVAVPLRDVENGKIFDILESWPDACLLLSDNQANEARKAAYLRIKGEYPEARIIPLDGETAVLGVATADGAIISQVYKYMSNGIRENIQNMVAYIASAYFGAPAPPPPKILPHDGIFSPVSHEVFANYSAYKEWRKADGEDTSLPAIGLLCHRSSWEREESAIEASLATELLGHGISLICGFTENTDADRSFEAIFEDLFCEQGAPVIDAFVNRMHFAAATTSPESSFEAAASFYGKLDMPVIKPIASYFCTVDNWQKEAHPISAEMAWSYMTPEIQGMIEPVFIGAKDAQDKPVPIKGGISNFAERAAKWVGLRKKANSDKRIALIMHNAPCSGVEATIGAAYQLDSFESVVQIMRRMQDEGYTLENIPENGGALKNLILDTKAISDFRWTSVEDIIASGGALHKMGLEEYDVWYSQLSGANRAKIEELYGPPPGEGMVEGDSLIITGLEFGNISLFVEPKRGCYGAKCTGEVCKILQDPLCPPPHQYLATFWHIQHGIKADAIVNVGTHGSMDFLPGKSSALSEDCWPVIALGSLPNLYIYNSAVPGEAVVAKRRAFGAIVDHMPSIASGARDEYKQLSRLIEEHRQASETGTAQADAIFGSIKKELSALPELLAMFDAEEDPAAGISLVSQLLASAASSPAISKRHVFGRAPDADGVAAYIDELSAKEAGPLPDADIRDIKAKLTLASQEMDSLFSGLSGGYIPPGIFGAPDNNGREFIPTGRNMFTSDSARIPTQTAYSIGEQLANALVDKYLEEEGVFPEQIAMNMISTDVTVSKGEQMSQMMSLMGIKPIWDSSGKVTGLEAIPLHELGRPRIDVTVRISGILRDSWPEIVALLDDAAMLAANLEEGEDTNYVRKHSLALLGELSAAGVEDAERRAAVRIFGDAPGSYGANIDLALKASAWNSENDLIRYFIEASAHAYGRGLDGQRSVAEFVASAKNTDVTYDLTMTKRYNVLNAGFSAGVTGGFGLIAKAYGGKNAKAYQGSTEKAGRIAVMGLEEKIAENMAETLFNPIWKKNILEEGYDGAAAIMGFVHNVFTLQVLSGVVGDSAIDRLVEEYVLDEHVREWFSKENRFALEEVSRRFIELGERGKWDGDPAVLKALKDAYLQIEGDMEDGLFLVGGEIQGGGIEIIADDKVDVWKRNLKEIDEFLGKTEVIQ
ncbi:MAG: cobaltochelatase subunit CobN [Eubacteriaceae bacterium]|nr:cobaltochelatase subunit CobN [Eubacteriaceae bacterium]